MKLTQLRLKKNFLFTWALLFVVNIVVRLPHFLSKNFFIDEDEAILGIMGQDLLSGQDFSYYFYGQDFGLSIFESISIALFIPLFGSTFWAIKLGALLIFSLGLTFLYKAISKKSTSKKFVFSLMLFLSAFPTWYLWASMSRGGYVTAFATACMIYYYTQYKDESHWKTIVLAVLTYITFDAHALLLLPAIPFLFEWWYKKDNKLKTSIIFTSIAIGLLIFAQYFLVAQRITHRSLEISHSSWQNLFLHFESWSNAFSGYYYFFLNIEPPTYWKYTSMILAFSLLLVVLYLSKKGHSQNKRIIVVSICSMLLGFVLLSTSEAKAPRYMIGEFTLLLFLFLYLITNVQGKLNVYFVLFLTALSTIGITAGSKIQRHWIGGENFKASLEETFNYAKSQDVKAVFALEHQYTWNYLYGKEIPASNIWWLNRTTQFSNRVEKIYLEEPSSVLLYSIPPYFYGVDKTKNFSNDTLRISKTIFVLRNVKNEHLKNIKRYHSNEQ